MMFLRMKQNFLKIYTICESKLGFHIHIVYFTVSLKNMHLHACDMYVKQM